MLMENRELDVFYRDAHYGAFHRDLEQALSCLLEGFGYVRHELGIDYWETKSMHFKRLDNALYAALEKTDGDL